MIIDTDTIAATLENVTDYVDVEFRVEITDDERVIVAFAVERDGDAEDEMDEDGELLTNHFQTISDAVADVMMAFGLVFVDSGPEGAHSRGWREFSGGEYQVWRC